LHRCWSALVAEPFPRGMAMRRKLDGERAAWHCDRVRMSTLLCRCQKRLNDKYTDLVSVLPNTASSNCRQKTVETPTQRLLHEDWYRENVHPA
jgi:hypothetical protein